jgi:DNA-binding XRE family transcriptional regulator
MIRLKQLRQEEGVTQLHVAKCLGLSKQTINNYESGAREPSIKVIISICKLFDVTSDYLLGISDKRTSNEALQESLIRKMEKFKKVEAKIIDIMTK